MYESNNFKDAIIPIELLNSYRIEDEQKLFILLVVFRRNHLINDHSLRDLLGNLKAGKLNRRVGTFHCKLNNVWYNDERILNIYIDVLSNVRDKDIPMQDFLFYVNKYLNKPRNYCIDYIIGNYIIPFINGINYSFNAYQSSYERDASARILSLFNISETLTKDNYRSYDRFEPIGYCCEDCDGDYEQYKSSQYNSYVWDNVRKEVKAEFKVYFDSIRDESYLKNPNPVDLLQP